nr:uncharacterized protein At2g34160-like [Ipomoea batatas]
MEEITEGVTNINISAGDLQKKNRIQVSSTKKPLFFYVNLAKRYMQQYSEVELSALGMAIATVVSVAEILKNNGLAVEKNVQLLATPSLIFGELEDKEIQAFGRDVDRREIMTSTVDVKDDSRGRPISKAKIEIVLGKSEKFDEIMAAAASEKDRGVEVLELVVLPTYENI